METVRVTLIEDYAVVQLHRGKVNAINLQMVHDLTQAFTELRDNDAVRGVILTGNPGVFSAGLDVVELYGNDEAEFERFWRDFSVLGELLLSFSKPVVAAISGHSPAGGCIMTLFCDYRIMLDGPFRIGLNETAIGLVIPNCVVDLLSHVIPPGPATQIILDGAMLTPQEALAIGLVNEVCSPEKIAERAVEKLKQWLAFDDAAWRGNKLMMRRPILSLFSEGFEVVFGEAQRHWWSPGCRANLGRIVASLKK
jgi:Delta3-Delta2-enoyl-CoA isomerase